MTTTDAIIVGAGLSGLKAAADLQAAGYSCIVLEANDRIGGKTLSVPSLPSKAEGDCGVVDVGAAWINDTNQSYMWALAKKYGIALEKQRTSGSSIFEDVDGQIQVLPYGVDPFPEPEAKAIVEFFFLFDRISAEVAEESFAGPRSQDLDKMTLAEFCREKSSSSAVGSMMTALTAAFVGVEATDVSALYMLRYVYSGTGMFNMISDKKDGGQYLRPHKGTLAFSQCLADELHPNTIRLCTPVVSIAQPSTTSKDCLVTTSDGTQYSCKKVMLSVPTSLYHTLTFHPPLPTSKQELGASTFLGYYSKTILVFSSPWWRTLAPNLSLSGTIQSSTGPISFTRDTCIPALGQYSISCFIVGETGRQWSKLPAEERKTAVLAQFYRIMKAALGSAGVGSKLGLPDPINIIEYEWAKQDWFWGAPSPVMGPGVLTSKAGKAIKDSWRDIVFIGTETADVWEGYMEGAVRPGTSIGHEQDVGGKVVDGIKSLDLGDGDDQNTAFVADTTCSSSAASNDSKAHDPYNGETPVPNNTDHELESHQTHTLRSSNLPYLSTLWTVAKHSPGLTAISKRFFFAPIRASSQTRPESSPVSDQTKAQDQDHVHRFRRQMGTADPEQRWQKSVIVDIVSSDGELWTKVSTVTERRLILELAKEGYGIDDWESDTEKSESDDQGEHPGSLTPSSGGHEYDIELLRTAKDLCAASRIAPRINYENPKIRFILPRLEEGSESQVDRIILQMRNLDIEVICKNSPTASQFPPLLSTATTNLFHQPSASAAVNALLPCLSPTTSPIPTLSNNPSHLTSTINLDCTILLALLSDISHLRSTNLPPHPSGKSSFHAAIRAQIAAEAQADETNISGETNYPASGATPSAPKKFSQATVSPSERLLEADLWPIMRGRNLVTTREAAKRMKEIVSTIGTESEKARVAGWFGPNFSIDPTSLETNDNTNHMDQVCIQTLQLHSDYPIPSDLHLPITIVHSPSPLPSPPIPLPLSPLNLSVFLTGWTQDITTVTSNRGVVRLLEEVICEALDGDEGIWNGMVREGHGSAEERKWKGPRVWVIGKGRSLIGKEKKIER